MVLYVPVFLLFLASISATPPAVTSRYVLTYLRRFIDSIFQYKKVAIGAITRSYAIAEIDFDQELNMVSNMVRCHPDLTHASGLRLLQCQHLWEPPREFGDFSRRH